MAVSIDAILNRKGHDVATIAPEATVAAAADLLRQHRIGALVVSRDGSAVDGIVSERDIVRRLSDVGAGCLELTVGEVMSTEVTTCSGGETADDLMGIMTEGRHRHVPVVKEGELAGIVSIGDVVKSRMDELETEAEALKEYVTGSKY